MLTEQQLNQATLEGRHVRVRASGEILANLFTTGRENRFRVVAGIPDDAVLAALEVITLGPGASSIDFLYLHPSFAPRAEGDPIPELLVILETLPG